MKVKGRGVKAAVSAPKGWPTLQEVVEASTTDSPYYVPAIHKEGAPCLALVNSEKLYTHYAKLYPYGVPLRQASQRMFSEYPLKRGYRVKRYA